MGSPRIHAQILLKSLLYELLAGQLPYDLGDGKIASAIRAIEESEPRSLSAVTRNLRGDLETIGRTYDKLGAFEDAERHLRSAVADFETQAVPLDERALMTTARLGLTLSQLDRLEEAEALLNQTQQRLIA